MNVCGAIMPDNISQYLKVYITDSHNGDFVVGYIGDGASGSLSADWSPPFAGFDLGSQAGQQASNTLQNAATEAKGLFKAGASMAAGILGKVGDMSGAVAGLFGTAQAAQINSAMVWQGQNPPAFTMPIYFLAHSDPELEVQRAISTLMKMASPQLNAVMPGGRVPSKVTLDIGRRIKLTNVIIQEVTYELDAPRNKDGYFLQNNVSLQLSGDIAYNRSDFNGMFI